MENRVHDQASGQAVPSSNLFGNYHSWVGQRDEFLNEFGEPRPHWTRLAKSFSAMSDADLAGRWTNVERLRYENGITYSFPTNEDAASRPWALDPVPLMMAEGEWAQLEQGVQQRAHLLNMLLADIYGSQRLLTSCALPAGLVFGNPDFLRPAHGIRQRGGNYLQYYAVDVARGRDGNWIVVKDHCEMPEGGGFALENRVVMSHCFPEIFREAQVRRLANFYQAMHQGLESLTRRDEPRIVVMTGGPDQQNYFAHAYFARYLGYTLAEGADLMVRDERVYLKTLDGLKPVDLILRRLPGEFCDPLELRADSLKGVPGLMQAIRAENVVVTNALGSGVVESAALMPFLPGLCRQLLGEELSLPSQETWWCGQPEGQQHILANLQNYRLKRAFGSFNRPDSAHVLDATDDVLPEMTEEEMRSAFRFKGGQFIAQAPLDLATAPILHNEKLIPSPFTLRIFLAANEGGYTVMPGGLVRTFHANTNQSICGLDAEGSKDCWVQTSVHRDSSSKLADRSKGIILRRTGRDLPSRAADNMFWLGRYAERAEGTMRVLRTLINRVIDDIRPSDDMPAMLRVIQPLAKKAGLQPLDLGPKDPDLPPALIAQTISLIRDVRLPYGLQDSIAQLQRTASLTRDRLSLDAWSTLGALDRAKLSRMPANPSTLRLADISDELDDGIRLLAAFSGMEMENMTRGQGWAFLDLGRRIERASHMIEMFLGLLAHGDPQEDGSLILLLDLADSFMTYRSRYLTTPQLAPVLDLLLLDETNPRSVAFQFAALLDHINRLNANREEPYRRADERIVLATLTDLRLADIASLCIKSRRGRRLKLVSLLNEVEESLPELSSTVARMYFTHTLDSTAITLMQPPGGAL
ncbi:MAG: circularly permuted type 2 ATP-grasp protein [Pseudomonadota bacterium]